MIDSVDLNIFLDWCGICGGDNSTCKEERGVYNRTEYGYNSVVRIPSGKFAFLLHSYIYIYIYKSELDSTWLFNFLYSLKEQSTLIFDNMDIIEIATMTHILP